MSVNFVIRGRLGNAIFRYLASSILCINYNLTYNCKVKQGKNIDDTIFSFIAENLINNNKPLLNGVSFNMSGFYQHDKIYNVFKKEIFEFINSNPHHYIYTDGINAGDRKSEMFKMYDILNTPTAFKKYIKMFYILD